MDTRNDDKKNELFSLFTTGMELGNMCILGHGVDMAFNGMERNGRLKWRGWMGMMESSTHTTLLHVDQSA